MPIYYKGSETERPSAAIELEQILRTPRPQRYTADADLAAAVNVALILGKPLLLTGDPGTGKTELAGHVAMALGLGEPERFDTPSTSRTPADCGSSASPILAEEKGREADRA